MTDRPFTILATAPLPNEKLGRIPASVVLEVVPFTEIHPRNDETLRTRVSVLASKKITVVFTSAYAVKSVFNMLNGKPDWRIYCIRNETRNTVADCFGMASVVGFADNAGNLSDCIIRDGNNEVNFFCGDQRLDVIPENMRKNKISCLEHIVYDTKLTPIQLKDRPDAVLFFSPSAVRSFFSMNTITESTRIFAMGTSTANAIKQNTDIPFIISPEPDKAFVFNMALDYALSHRTI